MHGGCTFIPDDLPRKCVPGHSQILCPGLPYALADKDDAGLLALAAEDDDAYGEDGRDERGGEAG